MKQRDTKKLVYTVRGIADLLQVSLHLAYEAVHRGGFESMWVGNRLLVLKAPFDRKRNGKPAEPQTDTE